MLHTIPPETPPSRLDTYLACVANISRSQATLWIEEGRVLLNGEPPKKNAKIKACDSLMFEEPTPLPLDAEPENIPLDVVHEDDDLIVINKPQGMVVHPAPGHAAGTLVNALLYHCKGNLSGINGVLRPGIVHRIDRDTSGLLVVAKNDFTHKHLAEQLERHAVSRTYFAVVRGALKEPTGKISLPIGRHPADRKKMAVLHSGQGKVRDAITHYQTLETFKGASLLSLQLETGRTHQIRVHLSTLGHPILGDTVYGGGATPFTLKHPRLFNGQTLHAGNLAFTHPRTGESVNFSCRLPDAFERVLTLLRTNS